MMKAGLDLRQSADYICRALNKELRSRLSRSPFVQTPSPTPSPCPPLVFQTPRGTPRARPGNMCKIAEYGAEDLDAPFLSSTCPILRGEEGTSSLLH